MPLWQVSTPLKQFFTSPCCGELEVALAGVAVVAQVRDAGARRASAAGASPRTAFAAFPEAARALVGSAGREREGRDEHQRRVEEQRDRGEASLSSLHRRCAIDLPGARHCPLVARGTRHLLYLPEIRIGFQLIWSLKRHYVQGVCPDGPRSPGDAAARTSSTSQAKIGVRRRRGADRLGERGPFLGSSSLPPPHKKVARLATVAQRRSGASR
jgi:hypothetical protein